MKYLICLSLVLLVACKSKPKINEVNVEMPATSIVAEAPAAADEVEGIIEHQISDYFNEKRAVEQVFVKDKKTGKRYELKFKDGQPGFRHGQKVKVRGKKNKKQGIEVETVEKADDSAALAVPAVKKPVVLLVNFQNAASTYSKAGIISQLYTAENSVSKRLQRISMSHISLNGDANGDGAYDVFGPFTINYNAPNCDYTGWGAAADAAASAAGVNLSLYTNRVYAMPVWSALGCGWSGIAYVGCGSSCQAWFAYDHPTLAQHELGHNWGMRHASTDPEDDGVFNAEYGDNSDEMGSPWANRNFNAPHLSHMGWLAAYPGRLKDVTASGIYEIQAIDVLPDASTKPYALRIPRSKGGHYYFSLRQASGEDDTIGSGFTTGVNVHSHAGGASRTMFIKVLGTGQSFVDGQTTVTQLSDPAGGNISVKVDMGSTPPPPPPPPPTFTLSGSTPKKTQISLSWTAVSDAAKYQVIRDNNLRAETVALSFLDTQTQSGTTYSYRIKAVSAAGAVLAESNSISVKTGGKPR